MHSATHRIPVSQISGRARRKLHSALELHGIVQKPARQLRLPSHWSLF